MKDKLNLLLKRIKENIIFIAFVIFIIVVFNINTPYSVYSPGGLINVDERLSGDIYKNEGKINLTYVTFSEGKIPNLILAFLLPSWDIVKTSDVTYDNETLEELNLRDRIQLYSSISNATYLAYKKSGKEINITGDASYIVSLADYSDTNLKIGDKILAVDNKTIHNFNDILNIIENHEINDKIEIKVSRKNKEIDCYAIVKEDEGTKRIGIGVTKINEYELNPEIDYKYKTNESGASGGLMLSLAMYNALTENDLTKGKNISGTGTIDEEGNVGEISGVKYKLAGAVKNKSEIFIVPSANYDEAMKEKEKNNYDIEIIEAISFDQVLEYLEK